MIFDVSRIAIGQVVAQSINLLALPVLTRLYQPEVFGAFAVFSAAIWILVVFATLQAEHLIITMRTKRMAKALTFAILFTVLLSGILIFALLETFIFLDLFQSITGDFNHLSVWLSLTVVVIGVNQVLRFYATYVGKFKAHSISVVLNSIGLVSVSIGYAIYVNGDAPVIGLIVGQITGMLISILPYILYTDILHVKERKLFYISYRILRSVVGKLPVLLVTHLSKTLSFRIPVFMVANVGGEISAGAFAMADRLISIPTGVFGQAVGQVFRHRFKSDKDDHVRQLEQPRAVIKATFVLALLSYGTFILVADPLVIFLLGENWAVVVPFVKIIAVMEMMNFIFYSVEDVAIIRGIYYYRMLWQFGQLCILMLLFVAVSVTDFIVDVENLVTVICLVRIVSIIYDLSRTWRSAKDIKIEAFSKWFKVD